MVDSIKKILWVIVISILCSWSDEKCRADELAVAFADPVLKQVVEKNLGVTDPTPTEMLRLIRVCRINRKLFIDRRLVSAYTVSSERDYHKMD